MRLRAALCAYLAGPMLGGCGYEVCEPGTSWCHRGTLYECPATHVPQALGSCDPDGGVPRLDREATDRAKDAAPATNDDLDVSLVDLGRSLPDGGQQANDGAYDRASPPVHDSGPADAFERPSPGGPCLDGGLPCERGMICSSGECVCDRRDQYLACHEGDVWWFDLCGLPVSRELQCAPYERCVHGECLCTTDEPRCRNGEIWTYNACEDRYGYPLAICGERCEAATCVERDCERAEGGRVCYRGDVWSVDGCGIKGELVELCNPLGGCADATCTDIVERVRGCVDRDVWHYDPATLQPVEPVAACIGSRFCYGGRCLDFQDRDEDGVRRPPDGVDCDDDDPLRYAGHPELWDARDNDCDDRFDEVSVDLWYRHQKDWGPMADGGVDLEHRWILQDAPVPDGFVWEGSWVRLYPVLDFCQVPDGPRDACFSLDDGQHYRFWGGRGLVALTECRGVVEEAHYSLYLPEGSDEQARWLAALPGLECRRIGYIPDDWTGPRMGPRSRRLYVHSSDEMNDVRWSVEPLEGEPDYDHAPSWWALEARDP